MQYYDHFDANGRQLAPLPHALMNVDRFMVGDKVEWLADESISESLNLKGQLGIVIRVKPGWRDGFPSVYSDLYDCWVTQHQAKLEVRFPYDHWGLEADLKTPKPRWCNLSEEGILWQLVLK